MQLDGQGIWRANEMTFKTFTAEYDAFVEERWLENPDPNVDLAHAALGLSGEVGEAEECFAMIHRSQARIHEKIKKSFRGDTFSSDYRISIIKELGDALFYLTRLAHLHDATLEEVIDANYVKLSSRAERGVIKGSGDNR